MIINRNHPLALTGMLRVFLNGKEMTDVVEADTDTGVVKIQPRSDDPKVINLVETLIGAVEIQAPDFVIHRWQHSLQFGNDVLMGLMALPYQKEQINSMKAFKKAVIKAFVESLNKFIEQGLFMPEKTEEQPKEAESQPEPENKVIAVDFTKKQQSDTVKNAQEPLIIVP